MPMPYVPVQTTKLFEQITEQIEQQILRGDLQSGDRLPTERELAEQFHASRTAVREAMKILAQKGLLEMRPGRGTIVINGTSQALRDSLGLMLRVAQADSARELVEVREILEPEIAALAAERATERDVVDLREAVETMDAHLHDADAFISADNFFHQALARATQNALVLTLMDPIMELLAEQRKQIFFVDGGPLRGQFHHKQLLDAVGRHDCEAARNAMRAHLQQVRADVSAAQALRANQKG
jgi:GntR family transcriptional regulator, transcriptional repressor for pyruvate dehydrogenase complex